MAGRTLQRSLLEWRGNTLDRARNLRSRSARERSPSRRPGRRLADRVAEVAGGVGDPILRGRRPDIGSATAVGDLGDPGRRLEGRRRPRGARGRRPGTSSSRSRSCATRCTHHQPPHPRQGQARRLHRASRSSPPRIAVEHHQTIHVDQRDQGVLCRDGGRAGLNATDPNAGWSALRIHVIDAGRACSTSASEADDGPSPCYTVGWFEADAPVEPVVGRCSACSCGAIFERRRAPRRRPSACHAARPSCSMS